MQGTTVKDFSNIRMYYVAARPEITLYHFVSINPVSSMSTIFLAIDIHNQIRMYVHILRNCYTHSNFFELIILLISL